MIALLDVDYRADEAQAACVLLRDWADATPAGEQIARLCGIAPYQPGAFYRRELPCLLAVLRNSAPPPATLMVDGYAWLGQDRPGLGVHLHEALGQKVPVIGVAKTRFAGAPAIEVCRGASRRPLFVSAVGLDATTAAAHVVAMHGPYRVPAMLRRVDQLCRAW